MTCVYCRMEYTIDDSANVDGMYCCNECIETKTHLEYAEDDRIELEHQEPHRANEEDQEHVFYATYYSKLYGEHVAILGSVSGVGKSMYIPRMYGDNIILQKTIHIAPNAEVLFNEVYYTCDPFKHLKHECDVMGGYQKLIPRRYERSIQDFDTSGFVEESEKPRKRRMKQHDLFPKVFYEHATRTNRLPKHSIRKRKPFRSIYHPR